MADNRAQLDTSSRAAISDLTAGFAIGTPLDQSLSSVTAAAVELVDGVDYADVILINEGRSESVSVTSPLLYQLDAVQVRLQEGPCLEAAVGGAMIRCDDLSDDRRWPGFAAAAVAVGVHSMLSYQLYTRSDGVGALNLFGKNTRILDPAAEAIGALLATLAAVALMTSDRRREFETALASRDIIGQAKGILMNHYKIDAPRAFDMLSKLSQNSNTPVRIIAKQIIDTL
ncbi:MAG: GAF and ANTAR domain-containing protein [Mycobacterium sp.]